MTDFSSPDLTQPGLRAQTLESVAQRGLERVGTIENLPEHVKRHVQIQQEEQVARSEAADNRASERESRAVRIKGRVVSHDEGGRYTVRTDDGDVTIRAERPQDRPRLGTQIDIRLPEDLEQPAVPVRITITLKPQDAPDGRVTQTPVDVYIAPPAAPPPVRTAEVIPVQLQPIPPEVAAQIAPATASVAIETQSLPAPLAPVLQLLHQAGQTGETGQINQSLSDTLLTLKALPKTALPVPSVLSLAEGVGQASPLPPHIAKHIIKPEAIVQIPQAAQTKLAPLPPLRTTAFISPPTQALPAGEVPVLLPAVSSPVLQHGFITKIVPPGLPDSSAPIALLSPAKAGQISATYIGKTAAQKPVIQLSPQPPATPWFESVYSLPTAQNSGAFFIMQGAVPVDLTPGSHITIQPQAINSRASDVAHSLPHNIPADIQALPIVGPYLLKTENWHAMQAVYQSLQRAAPQAAQAMVAMTPSASGNLAQIMPAVLFFVAAARGGDLSQWLGDKNIEILKKADGKALNKLLSEGDLLGRIGSEKSSSDWRSVPVPFYQNEQFQKVLLHFRQENRDQDQTPDKGKNVRFLFDLALDNMGNVQLDGLFHSGRMDLIVRTETKFSQAMQQEMRRLYAGAVEQAGVHGELSFQNSLSQFVEVRYR